MKLMLTPMLTGKLSLGIIPNCISVLTLCRAITNQNPNELIYRMLRTISSEIADISKAACLCNFFFLYPRRIGVEFIYTLYLCKFKL